MDLVASMLIVHCSKYHTNFSVYVRFLKVFNTLDLLHNLSVIIWSTRDIQVEEQPLSVLTLQKHRIGKLDTGILSTGSWLCSGLLSRLVLDYTTSTVVMS